MTRIRIITAYDGTDFSGFQKLPGKRTVEGELSRAISELCGEEIGIIGASRTDSGVHALGNVTVFDTSSSIPPERMALAINTRLPRDLRVLASESCEADWHPRKHASIKTYEYRIYNGRIEDPLGRRYRSFCPYSLDVEAMDSALKALVGTHDFTSFANPASQVLQRGGDAIRTIHEAGISRLSEGGFGGGAGELCIRISGSGFLYNMVRIIAGTVMEVGTGARRPEDMEQILMDRDRRSAGMTAEARGLFLRSIVYTEERQSPADHPKEKDI